MVCMCVCVLLQSALGSHLVWQMAVIQIPLVITIVIINFQGLFYEKDSEGAMYVASNGAVQPGETVWYKWTVPADFAPAEGDPSCINQAYYSAIDPAKDTNSGLIG